jgi:RNA polymerase sigma-70 factor (ECF subfamily)
VLTEQDLIERCLTGERDAQRELFEQTSPRIYRLLLRMTGSPDDAGELTQETFVTGLQRLGQFDGRSGIATWFYRIAINQALHFRRRKGTYRRKLQELAPRRPTEVHEPSVDVRLDLEGALAELSPDERAILLLRYQEQLDYRDIAEALACAEGTVASRLNRARERLRAILRGGYG